MAEPPRKLTPPFKVEDHDACFKVVDASGIGVAYCYFNESPTALRQHMTKAQARAMARQIAKLPDLVGRGDD
jgi:hypothetical protein